MTKRQLQFILWHAQVRPSLYVRPIWVGLVERYTHVYETTLADYLSMVYTHFFWILTGLLFLELAVTFLTLHICSPLPHLLFRV